MIDRAAVVGTFPDEHVCWVVSGACLALALALFAAAVLSWLKGK